MSDYIDIVEYLDEHNYYFFRPALAFISVVVAITVIPLHTQKMKFLANRFYWLYFSTYRIKLNINQIRIIMRKKTDSAQDELKKYIKQKHIALERLEGIIYKNETDRDTPQTVVEEIHVKNENMKYVFIDNNIWWYLEYYLFHFAIIGLVFLSRLLVSVTGNELFQTNAIGNTTRLFDLTASVTLVLALYFLDDDYRNPTSMIGGISWQILLGITMFLLIIGHVFIRYLPDNNINTLFEGKKLEAGGVLIFIVIILVVFIRILPLITQELFTSNLKELKEEEIEEEETIQDLIDKQLVQIKL